MGHEALLRRVEVLEDENKKLWAALSKHMATQAVHEVSISHNAKDIESIESKNILTRLIGKILNKFF